MIIQQITLRNWQGYYGPDHNFSFSSNSPSSIIYGKNTFGKTAFWESIEFALYGRVRRRKQPNKFKPFMSNQSSEKPLLNTDAFNEGKCDFGVEILFSHQESNYRLLRRYYPKYTNKKVEKNSDLNLQIELENLDDDTSDRFIKNENHWINENILPERLSKFFLFDAERLEEYEELMDSDRVDVRLKEDIEDIIRSPILKTGSHVFTKLGKSYYNEYDREYAKNLKNEKDRKRHEELTEAVANLKIAQTKLEDEKKSWDDKITSKEKWLTENDKSKEASIQIKNLKSQLETNEGNISSARDDLKEIIGNAWRVILQEQVNTANERLETEISLQAKMTKRLGVIEEELCDKNDEMEGKPCSHCGAKRHEPKPEERASLNNSILNLKEEQKKLINKSKFPTHDDIWKVRNALRPMTLPVNTTLNNLILKEKNLSSFLKNEFDFKQLLTEAEKLISDDKDRDIQSALQELRSFKGKRDDVLEKIGTKKSEIKAKSDELKGITFSSTKHKSLKMKRLQFGEELCGLLSELFTDTLEKYREKMRKGVEERASEIFLSISNNAENYAGLKINSDFTVNILNKKDTMDAGSGAQSLVTAYSVIDALAQCSGIEFPLVIDTPGRGLGVKNLNNVYTHFLKTNPQVIFLPNDLELDPEFGDKNYGKYVGTTYELSKVKGDRTEVIPRIKE